MTHAERLLTAGRELAERTSPDGDTDWNDRHRLEPGAVVGDRYEVRGTLGHYPFADTYGAFDRVTRDTVTIKIPRPNIVTSGLFEQIINTATLLAPITGVNTLFADVTGETPFLARTYLPDSADGHLFYGATPLASTAFTVLSEIAKVLDIAHHRGHCHGRIHPGNVLIRFEQRHAHGYLVDWLPASQLAGTPGDLVVSNPYAAPEVLAGHPYSPAADMYSFAYVAFTMFTGSKVPRCNTHEHAARWKGGFSPRIQAIYDELIRQLSSGMVLDPTERVASCSALMEPVGRLLREVGAIE